MDHLHLKSIHQYYQRGWVLLYTGMEELEDFGPHLFPSHDRGVTFFGDDNNLTDDTSFLTYDSTNKKLNFISDSVTGFIAASGDDLIDFRTPNRS